jgi:hypothetical protein
MEWIEVATVIASVAMSGITVWIAISRHRMDIEKHSNDLKLAEIQREREWSEKLLKIQRELTDLRLKIAEDFYHKEKVDQMFDRLTDRIESGFEKLEKHFDDMRART